VQTFGDLANFNPHVYVLTVDGAFRRDGTFVPLPAVPEGLLAEGFRRAVLEFLAQHGAISEVLRTKLPGWRYSGFSVHNQVWVGEGDAEGERLAFLHLQFVTPSSSEAPLAGVRLDECAVGEAGAD